MWFAVADITCRDGMTDSDLLCALQQCYISYSVAGAVVVKINLPL